jgi:hypothetical protein
MFDIKDDHIDDFVVENGNTMFMVSLECGQYDEFDMGAHRDFEEADHRCLTLRPVQSKSLWACSMSHESVDLDVIFDRYESVEALSSEPSGTRTLESVGTYDCVRGNSITGGLGAKELDMRVSSHQVQEEVSRQSTGKDEVSDLRVPCEMPSSMPSEDAAVLGNSRHGKRRGRRSPAVRLRCHLFLDPIMLDSGFDLVKKIIGRSGCNTFGIFQDTNTKIRVRGKGSGHRENNGREAPVPLMVALSADHENHEDFRSAYLRTRELLEGVCERFRLHRQRNRKTVPTAKLFWFGDLSESAKEALSDYVDESQCAELEWQ